MFHMEANKKMKNLTQITFWFFNLKKENGNKVDFDLVNFQMKHNTDHSAEKTNTNTWTRVQFVLILKWIRFGVENVLIGKQMAFSSNILYHHKCSIYELHFYWYSFIMDSIFLPKSSKQTRTNQREREIEENLSSLMASMFMTV